MLTLHIRPFFRKGDKHMNVDARALVLPTHKLYTAWNYYAFFDGDTAKARQLQLEMLPLADALFCEVNPIPVKYAMNVLGWEAGVCRLPLVEPSEAHKEYIEKALRAEGLITE